jgi:hypothetical protein
MLRLKQNTPVEQSTGVLLFVGNNGKRHRASAGI